MFSLAAAKAAAAATSCGKLGEETDIRRERCILRSSARLIRPGNGASLSFAPYFDMAAGDGGGIGEGPPR